MTHQPDTQVALSLRESGKPQSTRLVMAADHPTTSLNYPNHAAASFRNVHLVPDGGLSTMGVMLRRVRKAAGGAVGDSSGAPCGDGRI
jgi:hypothetical protein